MARGGTCCKYLVLDPLGSGGMSVVYRCVQTEPERPEQPDLREEIPCDDSEPVEGGLRAEPLPEPDPIPPEQMVDGGLRAEPLPEDPPPIAEPEVVKIRPSKDMPKRGGLRAHPIERDPLPGI